MPGVVTFSVGYMLAEPILIIVMFIIGSSNSSSIVNIIMAACWRSRGGRDLRCLAWCRK